MRARPARQLIRAAAERLLTWLEAAGATGQAAGLVRAGNYLAAAVMPRGRRTAKGGRGRVMGWRREVAEAASCRGNGCGKAARAWKRRRDGVRVMAMAP